jgi:GAF domain-containing protein
MFQSIIARVTEAIRSSLDLREVLDGIVKVVAENLRARGCLIGLTVAGGTRCDFHTSYGLSDRFIERITREPGNAVDEALRGSCVLILDARTDPRVPFREEAAREGVGSILHVPLMVHTTSIGVLCVFTHHVYEFSEDEVFLLKAVGDQCAFAIRNAQMFSDARHQYQELVDDFQKWFEQYQTFPRGQGLSG